MHVCSCSICIKIKLFLIRNFSSGVDPLSMHFQIETDLWLGLCPGNLSVCHWQWQLNTLLLPSCKQKMILSHEKHHRPLTKCLWPFVDDMPGISGGASPGERNEVVSLLIFTYISVHSSTFWLYFHFCFYMKWKLLN